MFGLVSLVYIFVLFGNAICILNEKRFLNKIGVSKGSGNLASRQAAELLGTFRSFFKFPLLFINVIFIMYEFFLG
ncbi:immediate early response 3-interacting protein 1 [Nematocida sp. LUAm3]|nr:immediate early response 3-interacting protein 1 [Nematocida sp. LUAm3]KAI5174659.1 immediate early response 3-interacting protein 1 [Nematocida sp. LUAm2]KAI5177780.1 immediate early response 3-interacting protein 1 [Nematocida sp. LUAm1]